MGQANVFRALAGRAKKHLRRRGMGIFLKEMMLHFPGIIIAPDIGELDLA